MRAGRGPSDRAAGNPVPSQSQLPVRHRREVAGYQALSLGGAIVQAVLSTMSQGMPAGSNPRVFAVDERLAPESR